MKFPWNHDSHRTVRVFPFPFSLFPFPFSLFPFPFPKKKKTKLKVGLMAQGTSVEAAWGIAQGGFGIAASLDEGWFGNGLCFFFFFFFFRMSNE